MYYKVFVLLLLTSGLDAARILAMYPTPSISHQAVFRPLTLELVKRGHEVVVITTDPMFPQGKAPPNLTEIDIHDLSYKMWRDTMLSPDLVTGSSDELVTQMKTMLVVLDSIFDVQINIEAVQKLINNKDEKFDLLFLEACATPALILRHTFEAPVILFSSFGALVGNYDTMGGPTFPLLYPVLTRQRLYNLTMWEKIKELYTHYSIVAITEEYNEKQNVRMRKRFGENALTIKELSGEVDMLFLNTHYLWEGNFPVPPNVIHLGGLHQTPSKELSNDLKAYLDASKHGVIYISFGTNVKPSFLPPERIRILTNVFSRLPYDVVWKWDQDDLPGRSKNIKLFKWLPQQDMLKHPKIKLFITQCGQQSTDEAITAGVPLVGMPMLADQWYNAEKYEHLGIGVKLELDTLTEEKFRHTVETVIQNDSYRYNVERLRTLMRDQPQSPLEKAVWWTEYVLRHGGARHLRSPAHNMTWRQYFEIDLVLVVIGVSLAVLLILVLALKSLYTLVRRNVLSGVKIKQN